MTFKNIIIFLILIFFLLIQISFLANSDFLHKNLQLIFIFLLTILLLAKFSLYYCLKWAIFAGLILDIYSQFVFGSYIISFVLTLFIVYLILYKFLTNKSYYTLIALVLIGTVSYNLILFILALFFYIINVTAFKIDFNLALLTGIFWQCLINMFIVTIVHLFRKRILKAFIIQT
ncbi:MAG: hypothetical protein ABID45_01315 [Patescibacteria group bacterium]